MMPLSHVSECRSACVQPGSVIKHVMTRILTLLLTAVCAASLMGAPAHALAHKGESYNAAQSIVPMSVAVSAVRQAYPGAEVLSGRLVNGENPYYMIRILTREGRRLDVRVDARSGRVRR